MSRIGKSPVVVAKDVTVSVADGQVVVKGPKGELTLAIPAGISVRQESDATWQMVLGKGGDAAIHGFFRAQFANAVTGVTTGWSKTLELSGVGYRASMNGTSITLTVGFTHPVVITPPAGIAFSVTEGKISVTGVDRQLVGQMAANIRAVKKPEPYKGKGIKYQGEYIRKKAGKSAKAVGGAPGAAK